MYKKIGLLILYTGMAYLIYIYGEDILTWFDKSNNIVWVIMIASLMALFPVIPYPVVGGVIGAAFGPVLGGFTTWCGSTIASILMFLFVRFGYQEWGAKVLHSHPSTEKVTVMFERNAFLMILFCRLIPFIPSIIVNVYSALSRVSFISYTIASSLGKIPAMLLFALIGNNFITAPKNIIITIGVYSVFLAITLFIYQLWKKKKFLVKIAK